MRTPLVAGNWKMNGSFEDTNLLVSAIADGLLPDEEDDTVKPGRKVDVLVCPPYVYLETAARIVYA